MGCDYSSSYLRDIETREGRMFKFCKIRLVSKYIDSQGLNRKRMELIETEVGNHKTVVMVWEKEIGEGSDNITFLKSFYSEVDAIIIEVKKDSSIVEDGLSALSNEIMDVQMNSSHQVVPVFVLIKDIQRSSKNEVKDQIETVSKEKNWKVKYTTELEKDSLMVKQISEDIYTIGVHPRKVTSTFTGRRI